MEQNIKKITETTIFRLFIRFLKENEIPLNVEAFNYTFTDRRSLHMHLLIAHYIGHLKENKVFIDDNLNTKSLNLRLKWIGVVRQNYNNVLMDNQKIYLSFDKQTSLCFNLLLPFQLDYRSHLIYNKLNRHYMTYG